MADDNELAVRIHEAALAHERAMAELMTKELADMRRLTLEAQKALSGQPLVVPFPG